MRNSINIKDFFSGSSLEQKERRSRERRSERTRSGKTIGVDGKRHIAPSNWGIGISMFQPSVLVSVILILLAVLAGVSAIPHDPGNVQISDFVQNPKLADGQLGKSPLTPFDTKGDAKKEDALNRGSSAQRIDNNGNHYVSRPGEQTQVFTEFGPKAPKAYGQDNFLNQKQVDERFKDTKGPVMYTGPGKGPTGTIAIKDPNTIENDQRRIAENASKWKGVLGGLSGKLRPKV